MNNNNNNNDIIVVTIPVHLFLDGKPYKKVRLQAKFYWYGGSSSSKPYYIMDDTTFMKTLFKQYDTLRPASLHTGYKTEWYVSTSEPVSLEKLKWESEDIFKGRDSTQELFYTEFKKRLEGKYIAFNVLNPRKSGLSCSLCGKEASLVHREHDYATNEWIAIDTYCSRACFDNTETTSK